MAAVAALVVLAVVEDHRGTGALGSVALAAGFLVVWLALSCRGRPAGAAAAHSALSRSPTRPGGGASSSAIWRVSSVSRRSISRNRRYDVAV